MELLAKYIKPSRSAPAEYWRLLVQERLHGALEVLAQVAHRDQILNGGRIEPFVRRMRRRASLVA